MASIRCRKETGLLYLDFTYHGVRCREQTLLPDTATNRTRLQVLADRIERAVNQGTFRYVDFFPNSSRARIDGNNTAVGNRERTGTRGAEVLGAAAKRATLPLFADFANVWFAESEPRWRTRYQVNMRVTIDKIFLPFFGNKHLDDITRADLLAFRAEIAKRPGRAGQTLSGKRTNKLMMQLRAILNEGCDRHEINSPARGIKALKQKRSEVHPFSLNEVERLAATIREDYRAYIIVRCLTGLRTGEANGLQWCDIDFEDNTFKVERAFSRDGDDDLKTESSKREIPMVPQVRAAFEAQRTRVVDGCPWVFHTPQGHPIDAVNFTNRVWYPLLRYLGFKARPPYHMRHTAATLMLASGENPEWVAKMLGHVNTDMLFRVYSRFVPNLTRQDGRAFAGLINSHAAGSRDAVLTEKQIDSMDAETLRRELRAAVSAGAHAGRNADH